MASVILGDRRKDERRKGERRGEDRRQSKRMDLDRRYTARRASIDRRLHSIAV